MEGDNMERLLAVGKKACSDFNQDNYTMPEQLFADSGTSDGAFDETNHDNLASIINQVEPDIKDIIIDNQPAAVVMTTTTGKQEATTNDLPKTTTNDLPKTTIDLPKNTIDLPKTTIDLPKTTIDLPKTTTDLPNTTIDLPKMTTDLPNTTTGKQGNNTSTISVGQQSTIGNDCSKVTNGKQMHDSNVKENQHVTTTAMVTVNHQITMEQPTIPDGTNNLSSITGKTDNHGLNNHSTGSIGYQDFIVNQPVGSGTSSKRGTTTNANHDQTMGEANSGITNPAPITHNQHVTTPGIPTLSVDHEPATIPKVTTLPVSSDALLQGDKKILLIPMNQLPSSMLQNNPCGPSMVILSPDNVLQTADGKSIKLINAPLKESTSPVVINQQQPLTNKQVVDQHAGKNIQENTTTNVTTMKPHGTNQPQRTIPGNKVNTPQTVPAVKKASVSPLKSNTSLSQVPNVTSVLNKLLESQTLLKSSTLSPNNVSNTSPVLTTAQATTATQISNKIPTMKTQVQTMKNPLPAKQVVPPQSLARLSQTMKPMAMKLQNKPQTKPSSKPTTSVWPSTPKNVIKLETKQPSIAKKIQAASTKTASVDKADVTRGPTLQEELDRKVPSISGRLGNIHSAQSQLKPLKNAKINNTNVWRCSLCGKRPYEIFLGGLFGPYNENKDPQLGSDHHVNKKRKHSSTEECESPTKSKSDTGHELWFHAECLVWSPGVCVVGEIITGYKQAVNDAKCNKCSTCDNFGASLACLQRSCKKFYHFSCAKEEDCVFDESNYTIQCGHHK